MWLVNLKTYFLLKLSTNKILKKTLVIIYTIKKLNQLFLLILILTIIF